MTPPYCVSILNCYLEVIMSWLPAVFKTKAREKETEEYLNANDFDKVNTPHGVVITHKRASHPGSRVIYPAVDTSDPWQVTYLVKLKEQVDEMWESRGGFNICVIDRAVENFKLYFTPETRALYDKLRPLHCMKFKDIHPAIVKQLPELLSFIFTEGQVRPGSVTIEQE